MTEKNNENRILFYLARFVFRSGDGNFRAINLKRSEELDEMFEDILFYRGAAFVRLKRFDEAVEHLNIDR